MSIYLFTLITTGIHYYTMCNNDFCQGPMNRIKKKELLNSVYYFNIYNSIC